MQQHIKMGNFKNYFPIDTNGKNLEQCTDIPRKWNKILKLLQGVCALIFVQFVTGYDHVNYCPEMKQLKNVIQL